MIRTQVQLTEGQVRALKELAARRRVPLAELIRLGVDRILAEDTQAERYRRASNLIGAFCDEAADVSQQHDRYLDEAYR